MVSAFCVNRVNRLLKINTSAANWLDPLAGPTLSPCLLYVLLMWLWQSNSYQSLLSYLTLCSLLDCLRPVGHCCCHLFIVLCSNCYRPNISWTVGRFVLFTLLTRNDRDERALKHINRLCYNELLLRNL